MVLVDGADPSLRETPQSIGYVIHDSRILGLGGSRGADGGEVDVSVVDVVSPTADGPVCVSKGGCVSVSRVGLSRIALTSEGVCGGGGGAQKTMW